MQIHAHLWRPYYGKESIERGARDFLTALSLANLVLLGAWRLLLGGTSYFAATEPRHFLALMSASVILAAVFWSGMAVARCCGRLAESLAKWLFLQIVVWFLFGCLAALVPDIAGALTLLAFFVPVLLLLTPTAPRKLAMLLLVLSPCVAFLFARSAWEISQLHPPRVVQGSFSRLNRDGPRVLLVVFDEMSESVAFEHRPEGVEMPAFDRLRGEAFVATEAYPPAGETAVSMPALLTGKAIRQVRPVNEHELRIRYLQGERFESLATSRTVFSDVQALGFGTAMIGWFHPYCAVLTGVDFCAHAKAGIGTPGIYEGRGWADSALDLMSQVVPILRVSNWATRRREQCIRETHEFEDSILTAATADALARFRSGLMVVHLAVPHPPALKDAGMLCANLVAADRELSEIRRIMEDRGTWDSTALFITSDHWWRPYTWTEFTSWLTAEKPYRQWDGDRRVPFIARLPGQRAGNVYTPRFNVLLAPNLICQVLAGKIRTPADMKTWLDVHRNDAPVLAYVYAQNLLVTADPGQEAREEKR